MSSREKDELQLTAKGIKMKLENRPRDIYVLSNKSNNRLTYEKLCHDSGSEGEEEAHGMKVGIENGESGSQPLLFARDSSETLVGREQRPPSPTLQASSGESSQLGNSVDPQRQRTELKAKMFLQQKTQLKAFIRDRN